MNQVADYKPTLWDKVADRLTRSKYTEVDNERIEKMLSGGFLFGFSASDIFIFLSALIALVILQLQPYLIPYLEGSLNQTSQPNSTFEAPIRKTSTPSSRLKTSSPSASPLLTDEDIKIKESDKIDQEVIEALKTEDEIFIIISLQEPPSATSSATDLSQLKSEIKSLQENVLAELSHSEFRLVQRYETIPGLTGWVTEEGLAKLTANQFVVRIGLDTGFKGSNSSLGE